MRAVVAACALLTGCFYIDPIISQPRVSIDPPQAIYRGGMVTLTAHFDPDSKPGETQWTVYSCLAFTSQADGCDETSFVAFEPDATTPYDTVTFMIPPTTKAGGKTQAISVVLVARSDRGAIAQLKGNSDFAVGDAPPAVQLDAQWHSLAVGAPIDLVATFGDIDDDVGGVTLDWVASGPAGDVMPDRVEIPQDPGDPAHRKEGRRLVPDAPGDWSVHVTATDPESATAGVERDFTVLADRPPCLAQWSPAVPPAGATLPVSTSTLFEVPLVDDDIDAYPPITGDPLFGTTAFAWSIRPPGATQFEPVVGPSSNHYAFDPALYTPGDLVELRVEIFDHTHLPPLSCDDTAATCSIASSASCLQRQTWRVEVR